MAIRRCPYCKAIIDEEDKYCNNCGTQLLFPEDEFIEEEIPGDKIIDDDQDEEEEQLEEELMEEKKQQEETELGEAEEEGEEEGAGEELKEAAAEEEIEEEEPQEEAKLAEYIEEEKVAEEIDEVEEPEEAKGSEAFSLEGESTEELEADEGRIEGEQEKERIEASALEPDEKEALERRLAPPKEEDAAKKYGLSIESDELVFKTKDLDNLTGTVDEGKENLEDFLESFQEKREANKVPTSDTGELPPWVRRIKGSTPTGELEEEREEEVTDEVEEEKPPTRPEWTTDSGIGIPEKVTQAELPLADTTETSPPEEQVVTAVDEGGEEGEAGQELPRRPRFSLKLKSKLVDLVFITALWLITLWFTSQVIGVSFFRLITRSPGPVLAFYFILLLLYFFLFLYFLGETLGDHYFSEGD